MKSYLPMRDLRAWSDSQIETLYPGCFALVMATGIISNALFFEGHREWSDALFAVNLIAYPWLALITILRFLRFWQAMRSDLFNPRLVFSFFTIVAGTDVFGVGLHLRGFTATALLLWLFALLVWFILIYFSFAVQTFLNTAHGANVVHGGWLIAIVGTESLVILGTLIAPAVGDLGRTVFVLIHMLWGVGIGLYGIFIVLFAHRIFFLDVGPDDITPLLWVVMGAAAISTNAGSTLILTESGMPFLDLDAAIHRRRNADHVGVGDLVDSAVAAFRNLETRRVPRASDIHPDVLESGVPARHVCLGQLASFARGRFSAVACDILCHGLGGACSLGCDSRRPRCSVLDRVSASSSGRAPGSRLDVRKGSRQARLTTRRRCENGSFLDLADQSP